MKKMTYLEMQQIRGVNDDNKEEYKKPPQSPGGIMLPESAKPE